MKVTRRSFLESTTAIAGCSILPASIVAADSGSIHEHSFTQPSYAVIPVVGDGKWIWTEPPKDGKTGYLEERDFEVSVGIHLLGRGHASGIQASTVAPIAYPEQQVTDFKIETLGCAASLFQVNESAAQLLLAAPRIESGQQVSAVANYRIKISKDYRGFSRDSFPAVQSPGKKSKLDPFAKIYYRNSPGINIRNSLVKDIIQQLSSDEPHPWDLAKRFHEWVWDNIKGIPGKYTSVEEAIKNRKGDCEERATVFIALCRAAGIPSRLVWVPSHNWAEIGLTDHEGKKHWVPVHTAAYSWFGWTGAHEIVLQKGDRVHLTARKQTIRLVDDWYRLKGKRPEIYFSSTVTPVAPDGQDAGPGGREKLRDGSWQLTGDHPAKSFMRDK